MQANLDKTIQIKEIDAGFIHVEFLRREPQGATGRDEPKETRDIQIFGGKEWQAVKRSIDKRGLMHIDYDEMRIVHDPSKQVEPKAKSPGRPAKSNVKKD